jgi:hypothetical protein
MSDAFQVRIAPDQLDQFKTQSKALCQAIVDITGQPRIKPRRGHDHYAYACGYSSYSQVVVLSKGMVPAGETLLIARDQHLPVLADRLSGRIEYLSFEEAQQALLAMRSATSLGYMITALIKGALGQALGDRVEAEEKQGSDSPLPQEVDFRAVPYVEQGLSELGAHRPHALIPIRVVQKHSDGISSDAELERAKARMQEHRSALSERLRFTLSVPALDDRGVIVGHKRKVKA